MAGDGGSLAFLDRTESHSAAGGAPSVHLALEVDGSARGTIYIVHVE